MTDSAQTYDQYQDALKIEQEGKTKEQLLEELPAEYKLDLDNLPKQKHNFIKRGIVVSCEGAGHPNHRHFLTGK